MIFKFYFWYINAYKCKFTKLQLTIIHFYKLKTFIYSSMIQFIVMLMNVIFIENQFEENVSRKERNYLDISMDLNIYIL